ncbi:MAG: hypothetical protein SHS37scaffold220_68 [Phage 67_12]|nr:MAG: hypothetical protein SHS37scaffold220_68 [Phage 67_12]
MNFNFKTAISSIAPTLATMLGGPLAGTAVTALESALGLDPGAGADGITKAVAAGMTPEQISQVRAADQAHAERLKQMDIDVVKMNDDFEQAQEKTAADDRDSARKLQIANHSRVPAVLTAFLTTAFVGIILARMFGAFTAKDAADPLTNQMIGQLGMVWLASCTYWFGTTRSSAAKDVTIASQAKAAAAP